MRDDRHRSGRKTLAQRAKSGDLEVKWQATWGMSDENLVADPKAVLSGVLQDWGLTLENLDAIVKRPSKTTLASSPIAGGDQQNQLTYWQKTLEPRQIDLILGMTHEMGISLYDQTAKVPSFGDFA